MTRAELLEVLTVERHAPGPRPPRTSAVCDPPRPLTADEQAHNRRVLSDAIGGDLHAVAWNEGAA